MTTKFNHKPRFQTVEQHHDKKFNDKTKPSFGKPNKPYAKSEKSDRLSTGTIYPREAKKARGEGQVQITLKNQQSSEKKTGALSPRAPEKIQKNRREEMKVYGENACLTLFAERPEAIVRLWATIEASHKLGSLLSYLAEQKKAYHIVDHDEMMRVTGTEHHGGICLLVKKSVPYSLEGYLQISRQQDCLLLIDEVHNAQNIGGLLRTCAFYGVKGIVVESGDLLHSSAAARVAEGGLEFVRALETKHKIIALEQLRQAGYQIVHLTQQKQQPILAKTNFASKVVFVLSETPSRDIVFNQDTYIQLSFENPLNSGLNVAVSAGILLAAWYQQQRI